MSKLKVCRVFFNVVDAKGKVKVKKSKSSFVSKWAHAVWVLATTEKKAKEFVIGYMRDIECVIVDRKTISCDPAFIAIEGTVLF